MPIVTQIATGTMATTGVCTTATGVTNVTPGLLTSTGHWGQIGWPQTPITNTPTTWTYPMGGAQVYTTTPPYYSTFIGIFPRGKKGEEFRVIACIQSVSTGEETDKIYAYFMSSPAFKTFGEAKFYGTKMGIPESYLSSVQKFAYPFKQYEEIRRVNEVITKLDKE